MTLLTRKSYMLHHQTSILVHQMFSLRRIDTSLFTLDLIHHNMTLVTCSWAGQICRRPLGAFPMVDLQTIFLSFYYVFVFLEKNFWTIFFGETFQARSPNSRFTDHFPLIRTSLVFLEKNFWRNFSSKVLKQNFKSFVKNIGKRIKKNLLEECFVKIQIKHHRKAKEKRTQSLPRSTRALP